MGVNQSPPKRQQSVDQNRLHSSAKMRVFGALPTVLLLMTKEVLAEDFFTPSKCVSTIVSCCNPNQAPGQHPFRCFEVNECGGLFWEGTNACSDRTVARAIAALSPNEMETRVAHIDDNTVEIEIEHRLRPKQKGTSKNARRRKIRPRRNWILLGRGQSVRPRVHPASNKHYLTIGGIGAI